MPGVSRKLYQRVYAKVDWELISIHQQLSENFIIEFQDKVYWEWISAYLQYQKFYKMI